MDAERAEFNRSLHDMRSQITAARLMIETLRNNCIGCKDVLRDLDNVFDQMIAIVEKCHARINGKV